MSNFYGSITGDGDEASTAWRLVLGAIAQECTFDTHETLPLDTFTEASVGLTMIPLEISTQGSTGADRRRLAVSMDFVTRDQFSLWPSAQSLACGPGHPHGASANPSYREAIDYCTWVSGISGRTFRLLTDHDFEAIARAMTSPTKDIVVGPRDNVESLRHFLRAMWTWIDGTQCRQITDLVVEVATVRGGCWITSNTEAIPRATLTTTCRLPFVGLRLAADL